MKLPKCDFGWKSCVLPLATTWALLSLPPRLQADLVAYWNFDDGATVTDQWGSNDGTVIHNAGFNADTPDGSPFSLDLSATGLGTVQDYVRIGPAANGDGTPPGRDLGISATNSFTIATWVNYTLSFRGIISIKHDLASGGSADGDRSGITFGIGNLSGIGEKSVFVGIIVSDGEDTNNPHQTFRDVIATDQIVPFNEWHHLAVTYDFDSDTMATYLDGVASTNYQTDARTDPVGTDGTGVTGGAGIDFTDSFGSFTGFGASGNGPPFGSRSAGDFTRMFYDGLIDDVGVWDHAISAASVALLAAGDAIPPEILNTPPNPADLNMDGFVDGLDLGTLLGSWGTTTTPELGELNGTPPVDGLDLGALLAEWNPPPPGPSSTVPEPGSAVLAMLAAAGLVGRAGRRRCVT